MDIITTGGIFFLHHFESSVQNEENLMYNMEAYGAVGGNCRVLFVCLYVLLFKCLTL